MFTTRSTHRAAVCAALLSLLMACGGGGSGGSTQSAGVGTLRVALTDAPSCGYDAVHVTIDKIRVHQSASAGDNDAGWNDLPVAPSRRINLLDLRASKAIRFGATKLDLMAQVFNLLNTRNLQAQYGGGRVGNALSDAFGRIQTARPGLQGEFAVRFAW